MNERIKELSKQAGGGPSKWYTDPDVLEKFAELIINDCLAQADSMADSLEKDGADKESLGASWAAFAIARRYGLS